MKSKLSKGRGQCHLHNTAQNVKQNTMKKLPKWGDLNTLERHRLVGELIDAMIYSGEAVDELINIVEKFKKLGYVRSVILPRDIDDIQDYSITETAI